MSKREVYQLQNLSCAAPAIDLEKRVCALPGVELARFNIMVQAFTLVLEDDCPEETLDAIDDLVSNLEPGFKLNR